MGLRLFWAAAGLLAYTYVVFPCLVLLRAALRRVPYRTDAITPRVSLLIAAYNEADSIDAKLTNSLELDYPPDRFEIVVASDGSTDGTTEIVERRSDPRVTLLSLPRQGKAAALEAAVAASTGEILVFSDANSVYAPDAIRALVRPFADPSVGGVAGNQRYRSEADADGTAEGERAYWNMDRVLKEAESRAGSTISATGAIYAIRRILFDGVPVGVTDDFAVSTAVVEKGYRLVFAPDAVAWETVASTGKSEWGRKVRVMTRGLRGVYERRRLLDPRRYGFYAIQLLSHKLLRRLMSVPLLVMFVVSPGLWHRGSLYRLAAVVQVITYGLGIVGLVVRKRPLGRHPILATPGFFLLVNAAALNATWNVIRGRRIDRWEPVRSQSATGRDGRDGGEVGATAAGERR
ncbi:MAG TPA: glycosyltransferase family 2 protein [Candidatus Limnocylindria bacterium]|nr:glycosyltransferase family 2 protein [Candidatus Limnocylindria bacterium]